MFDAGKTLFGTGKASFIEKRRSLLEVFFLFIGIASLTYVIYLLPYYGDYDYVFFKVGQNPLNPYSVGGFFNAPWLAWILAPFSLFPPHVSGALWVTASILAVVWSIRKMQGTALAVLFTLLSPPFIRFITAGEIDAVPLLGFALLLTAGHIDVKGLGIVMMGLKPQTLGAGALVYWWNLDHRLKLRVLVVPVVVLLISFFIYGFWPLLIPLSQLNFKIDYSPWPYGIPIGIIILGWAMWRNKPRIGALSTYFLMPYVSPSTIFAYTAILYSVSPRWLSIILFILLWAVSIWAI